MSEVNFSENIELSPKEKSQFLNTPSEVTKVKRIVSEKVEEPGNLEVITEGLLYIAGDEGLRLEQLATVLDKSLEDAEVILRNIAHKYTSSLYALELVWYAGVYKFVTKKAVYEYAQKLFQETKPNTLSQSALETLAIIAYKQPITRVEIEELRGVGADMMLRKLLARNLIKEAGRSEAPGKPILYEVTDEFMDSFKLVSLKELPDLPSFSSDTENDLFGQ